MSQALRRWAEWFDVPLTRGSGAGTPTTARRTSRSVVVVDLEALDGVRLRDGIVTDR